LPVLIEIFRPLATRRPHRQQALHNLRRAQPAPAALQLDLPVDHRRCPGLAKRLDQPGHPGMASPVSSSTSISKSNRSAISSPAPCG
jgi:hypothetical protein